jgi:hypothetical protein
MIANLAHQIWAAAGSERPAGGIAMEIYHS